MEEKEIYVRKMYSLKFIKYQETNICYLQKFDGKGCWCEGMGTGNNYLLAFLELIKHCFRYGKMKKLLKVREVIK